MTQEDQFHDFMDFQGKKGLFVELSLRGLAPLLAGSVSGHHARPSGVFLTKQG